MGKALKILVVILLILNITAAYFATQLFAKNKLAQASESKLRETVASLATYIEEAPEVEEGANARTLTGEIKDLSEDLQTTTRTKLWAEYNLDLESTDVPAVKVASRDLDPKATAELKKLDTATAAIEKLAKAQNDRITDLRLQAKALRGEYITTLQELDKVATKLAETEATVDKQEGEITEANDKLQPLQEEKEQLEASFSELQEKYDAQSTEMENLTAQLAEITDEIAALKQKAKDVPVIQQAATTGVVQSASLRIEPGYKGRVTYFDTNWNFAVIELHETFMKELLGEELNRPLPEGVELMIYRQGDKGTFVTKVQLSSIRVKEGLGVGDVVHGWTDSEGYPAREGDGAFF